MSPTKATTGPSIPCRVCGGSGKIHLSAGMYRVYQLVQQGFDTADAVYNQLDKADDIGKKAVSMRLKILWEDGVLTRNETKRGRQWAYGVAEQREEESR